MYSNFIMSFIPLFVAFDAIGILPIYMSLTQDMDSNVKKKVLTHSIITATAITVIFLFVGKGIFMILGITISDFQYYYLGFSDSRWTHTPGNCDYRHNILTSDEQKTTSVCWYGSDWNTIDCRAGLTNYVDYA